jgi:hypothetical protein
MLFNTEYGSLTNLHILDVTWYSLSVGVYGLIFHYCTITYHVANHTK